MTRLNMTTHRISHVDRVAQGQGMKEIEKSKAMSKKMMRNNNLICILTFQVLLCLG